MEMRRKERELPEAEARSLLKRGVYGVLSTIGPDGYPYGVPVNYVYDEVQQVILIHGAREAGHKYENICFSPKACFTVVGDTQILQEKFSTKYESAIAFGTVELVKDKVPALRALVDKYSKEFTEKGYQYAQNSQDQVTIYALHIERLTGKARKNG